MKLLALLAAAVLACNALALPAAFADSPPWAHKGGRKEAERSPRADSGISLDEAVNRAERKYRARVIRAETRESNGRRVHQLRLLSDDGRVWTVRIDAANGEEL
ncbi:MAG TPA: PepSY domain-containing protein [Steroidobacteraceae bacterium]|nr:PepSY domain-containing protein [Steroidobacteraceae bacterium]HQZ79081.1 PepSY domain-containing protein [Steroidobacteraceae bacterium]